MLILALESSTSSAKALLYDTTSHRIEVESRAYGETIDKKGTTDTEGVCRLTLELGAALAKGKPVEIVTLCGTWHSIGLCNHALEPVTPTFSWNYMQAAVTGRKIRWNHELYRELYSRTGCVPHVTYPRQTLMYLRESGIDFRGKLLISQGAYNFFRLTGEYIESVSTVSGSGLLNIHKLDYDEYVLDLLGISRSQLAPLGSYKNISSLNAFGAAALGIREGTPILPAYPDGALNQFLYSRVKERLTASVGTSGAVRISADHPILPDGNQLWCYYGIENWISGAATAGACNCVNWFMQTFLNGRYSFARLEQSDDVGENIPVFLPFLFGERCPGWNDTRTAGFEEVSGAHTMRDFYRALQAGILFNLLQCYEILTVDLDTPHEIALSGGILHSVQWTQMFADIFGRQIAVPKMANASTMGAILLGIRSSGEGLDILPQLEGIERMVQPRRKYEKYYKQQYQRYLEWYERTSRERGDG